MLLERSGPTIAPRHVSATRARSRESIIGRSGPRAAWDGVTDPFEGEAG